MSEVVATALRRFPSELPCPVAQHAHGIICCPRYARILGFDCIRERGNASSECISE